MGRTAKVELSNRDFQNLQEGRMIEIRLPKDVTLLQISRTERLEHFRYPVGDSVVLDQMWERFDSFWDDFDKLWKQFMGKK
jgi:hypothetical protein